MKEPTPRKKNVQEECQLEFGGCALPVPSDKSSEPVMLTREQSLLLIEIIYMRIKRCYEQ